MSSEIERDAQMARGYRDKEFRDHLTGQEAVEAIEWDKWKERRKEEKEYARQFLADAEEARHDMRKEGPRLAIELSDEDVEQMYQEYLAKQTNKEKSNERKR